MRTVHVNKIESSYIGRLPIGTVFSGPYDYDGFCLLLDNKTMGKQYDWYCCLSSCSLESTTYSSFGDTECHVANGEFVIDSVGKSAVPFSKITNCHNKGETFIVNGVSGLFMHVREEGMGSHDHFYVNLFNGKCQQITERYNDDKRRWDLDFEPTPGFEGWKKWKVIPVSAHFVFKGVRKTELIRKEILEERKEYEKRQKEKAKNKTEV